MMANSNLAQAEQYLKHLERSLKEIGDQHKLLHDAHSTLQTNLHESISVISQSWAKVIHLFVILDGLRESLQETTDD